MTGFESFAEVVIHAPQELTSRIPSRLLRFLFAAVVGIPLTLLLFAIFMLPLALVALWDTVE